MGVGLSLLDSGLLIAVMALGTYFQTITGFGLAMIILGISGGLGIGNVPLLATVVSLISLVNSAIALRGQYQHIDWKITHTVLVGVIPASIMGVILLNYLNLQARHILGLLLGLLIIYSGVIFSLTPRKQAQPSSLKAFFSMGFIAGLCGGLFGMPGPPIIYQMYQQPFQLVRIRCMLLFIFAITALSRTLYELFVSGLPAGTVALTLIALPSVALATWAAQRFPPPLGPLAMRRITFTSLILIGLFLSGQNLLDLLH